MPNLPKPSTLWRISTVVFAIIAAGALAVAAVAVWNLGEVVDKQCQDQAVNRGYIRELVKRATTPTAAGPSRVDYLKALPEFQALDAEEQAFWLVVLTTSSNNTSISDSLKDYAASLTDIDCG